MTSNLSGNVRLSDSLECSTVDLVTFLRLKNVYIPGFWLLKLCTQEGSGTQHTRSFGVQFISIIIWLYWLTTHRPAVSHRADPAAWPPQVVLCPALPCRRKPSRSKREKNSCTSTSLPRLACRIDSATLTSPQRRTGTAWPGSTHGCWRRWVCLWVTPSQLSLLRRPEPDLQALSVTSEPFDRLFLNLSLPRQVLAHGINYLKVTAHHSASRDSSDFVLLTQRKTLVVCWVNCLSTTLTLYHLHLQCFSQIYSL